MNKTLLAFGVVALLAVGVLGTTYPKADAPLASQGPRGEQGVQGPAGPQGERGPQGPAGQSVQGLQSLLSALQGLLTSFQSQPAQPKLGATPGRDLPNPYCVGGVCTAVVEGTCANATTTLAAITNPFRNSTSTVDWAVVEVTQPATTTASLTLATSTLVRFAPATLADRSATTTSLINAAPLFQAASGRGTTTIVSSNANTDGAWNAATTTGAIASVRDVVLGPGSATTSPSSNLVLWVDNYAGVGSTAGITNTNNNFACNYKVRFTAFDK